VSEVAQCAIAKRHLLTLVGFLLLSVVKELRRDADSNQVRPCRIRWYLWSPF
jgi:hypothetical protein